MMYWSWKDNACVSNINPLHEDLISARRFMLTLSFSSSSALYCSEVVLRTTCKATNWVSFVSNVIRDGVKIYHWPFCLLDLLLMPYNTQSRDESATNGHCWGGYLIAAKTYWTGHLDSGGRCPHSYLSNHVSNLRFGVINLACSNNYPHYCESRSIYDTYGEINPTYSSHCMRT